MRNINSNYRKQYLKDVLAKKEWKRLLDVLYYSCMDPQNEYGFEALEREERFEDKVMVMHAINYLTYLSDASAGKKYTSDGMRMVDSYRISFDKWLALGGPGLLPPK